MAYQLAQEILSEERSEPKAGVVEAAQGLIVQMVKFLARDCPPGILGEAAREDLLALKPHLEEALEALEDIKRLRSLTEEELTQQYAFKMLLAHRG